MALVPTQVTDLPTLAVQAAADWFYIVDASNTTESPAGSSNKLSLSRLAWTDGSPATVTGGGTVALGGFTVTIPGSGVLVTTTGVQTLSGKSFSDFVGIGTIATSIRLHVYQDINNDAEIRIQNPNVGPLARAMLRLVSDGGTIENAVLLKHSKAHANYPNHVVLLNNEGDVVLVTDGGEVRLSDAGVYSVTGPAGSISLNAAGAFSVTGPGGMLVFNAAGTLNVPNGLYVAGSITATGGVTAAALHITGIATVDGELDVDGPVVITGDLTLDGGNLSTNGDLNSTGEVTGDIVTARDSLHAQALTQLDGNVGIGKAPTSIKLDVNGAVQATQLGSAWTALTPGSGWGAGPYAPQYKRFGDQVTLRGSLARTGAAVAFGSMLTMPAGFRPGQTWVRDVPRSNDPALAGSMTTTGVLDVNIRGGDANITTGTHVYLDGISFSTAA